MTKRIAIKLFEQKQVRAFWDENKQKWYFSIIDVIEILTESKRPRKYWSDLKNKLKSEGSELSEKIGRLKMKSSDGKMRFADVVRKQLETTTGKKVLATKMPNQYNYRMMIKNWENNKYDSKI